MIPPAIASAVIKVMTGSPVIFVMKGVRIDTGLCSPVLAADRIGSGPKRSRTGNHQIAVRSNVPRPISPASKVARLFHPKKIQKSRPIPIA